MNPVIVIICTLLNTSIKALNSQWNIIKTRLFRRMKHTIQARGVYFLSAEVEGHLAYLYKYKMILNNRRNLL